MFAVKGWSVSADKLKPEAASAPADAGAGATAAASKKSKKRKRQAETVTSSNVSDLWEKIIEHKEPQAQDKTPATQSKGKKGRKDKKRQKLNSDHESSEKRPEPQQKDEPEQEGTLSKATESPLVKDKREEKKKKKSKAKKNSQKGAEANLDSPEQKHVAPQSKPPTNAASVAVAVPPAPPKLTPLQASMREKLISARFRHLNETLYTRPSAEAFSLFQHSPEMFTEYHEGFRRQVEVWPENPVEGYLADVRARAKARHPPRGDDRRGGKKPSGNNDNNNSSTHQQQQQQPLPRNRATGTCTIADLGCGDARLASELQADKAKLRLDIMSFDLTSPHPLVTRADMANLPVASGTVDVAIFCLALMGTNWIDFVEEAYRILRWKGELWVAEIKSRFGHTGSSGGGKKGGSGSVVEHSVGNRRKPAATKKGGKDSNSNAAAAADETALLVEVDGVDDTRQQTDVSAFVQVLNKRGFMLQGQDQGHGAEAIDASNKMFVKMRFVKAAPAVKGKCVQKEDDKLKVGPRPGFAKKPKFIDADDEGVNEAAVLKPCVYKIR